MTEKRLYDVINEAEPRGQSVTYKGIPCTARTCVTRLNILTEENNKFKKENIELRQTNNDLLNAIMGSDEHYKEIIQEAYESERTAIGKSVLKQLMENIE